MKIEKIFFLFGFVNSRALNLFKVRRKRSATVGTSVKINKSNCRNIPTFEFAENINCTGPIGFGESCSHQCGSTLVTSTCSKRYLGSTTILLGEQWTHDAQCNIKREEKQINLTGMQTLATDKEDCEDRVEQEIAERLKEDIVAKCLDNCEVSHSL